MFEISKLGSYGASIGRTLRVLLFGKEFETIKHQTVETSQV